MISRSRKTTVRPVAKLVTLACGIAAMLGLATTSPALAAPAFDIELRKDAISSAGSQHEVQLVRVKATAGQFRLTFKGDTTTDLPFNAAAVQVREALNALASINAGGGSVSIESFVLRSYRVVFDGGPLANTDVPQLIATEGTTPLTGGFSQIQVATLFQAAVSRSDQRVDYSVKVKNVASANTPPVVGDPLSCAGAPPFRTWTGTPAPTFTYQWLRDGVPIAGATDVKHTVVGADQGHSLQCRVTGTNTTNGSTSSAVVSGPVVVLPLPAISPPAPISPTATASRPVITASPTTSPSPAGAVLTCEPPTGWTSSATANTASGSATLSAVATARGTARVSTTTNPNVLTNVTTTGGIFAVGQTVTIAGFAAGTTITAVDAANKTLTLSNPATSNDGPEKAITAGSQPFAVGEAIFGRNIPPGTTITAVSGQSITLSANATATATGIVVSSAATGTWGFQWLRNGTPIPGATANTYTVEAADAGKTMQCEASGSTGDGGLTSGGRAVGISLNRLAAGGATTLTTANTPANAVGQTPFIPGRNDVFDPVTVEVEIPPGAGSSVLFGLFATEGTGWSCTGQPPAGLQPAKAICTRPGTGSGEVANNLLSPGASYPPLTIAAGLSPEAPDHAIAEATISGGGAAPDSDTEEFDFAPAKEFGIEAFDSEVLKVDGEDYKQAGGHPFAGSINFRVPTYKNASNGRRMPLGGNVRKAITDLPRGFVGNALAVPALCPSVVEVAAASCPTGSAVGVINVGIVVSTDNGELEMPIFAIEPEFGAPAQFAFFEQANVQTPFTITPRLRADDGYAITLEASSAPLQPPLTRVNEATLCSFGAKVKGNTFEGCKEASDPTANPMPLITNPTRCAGAPPTVELHLDSWEEPNVFKSKTSVDPMPEGCNQVDFQPEATLTPTNKQADTPTGLDVEMTMPTEGLETNKGIAQSNLANAVVTLPEGMSVNPAAAHGLASCSPEQVKLGSNADHECPLSSQVGTIEIDTPLIQETLKGHVFMASQKDNPFDSMLGLYLVFASEKDGITIKVAGKLDADPVTGQLTSTFVENPEAPFSRLSIKFNSGPRAPLINPPKCGTYAIRTELSPWTAVDPTNPTKDEIVSEDSLYQVTSGPNGAPCPPGNLEPKLDAGLKNPIAGSKSPFVLKLTRDEGTQRFSALDLEMPQGLVAYLKGVQSCPQSTIDGISEAQLAGRPELASPACPANSQVGSVQAGAGGGPYPFYAQGKVYLAGPYRGAPLSLAVVTPAVAGPFDLGNVVVQNAVYVDPKTAKVSVKSDPIPTILHGLMLNVRDIRVNIDRPDFTAAPTSCEPASIGARVGGENGASASLSNRFQVGECAALGFAPRISLSLRGGTKRGDNPALKAVVRPRAGEANIAAAAVTLPRSAFLDQAHIRTICTRVQFAADNCPAAAIYGRAEAVTPLLDQPLSGPVYLRSSSNKLPDLVADLRGPANQPIKVEVAFRTDSVRGGIRSTLDFAPDAPVTKFTLQMQGGKKGLVINSQNLCANTNRANAKLLGHNGARFDSKPKVVPQGCKKARKGKKRKANR